jgi:FAD binding domain
MESLTSKVKNALNLDAQGTQQASSSASSTPAAAPVGTGHTFKSQDGSLPSNHQSGGRVLPPNTTEAQLDAALGDMKAIVGVTNVDVVDVNTLMDGDYMHQPKTHDGYYVLNQDELVASAVVRPGNTEEVQALVRIANKYKIPIWITSVGRNLGYGGAARTSPLLVFWY